VLSNCYSSLRIQNKRGHRGIRTILDETALAMLFFTFNCSLRKYQSDILHQDKKRSIIGAIYVDCIAWIFVADCYRIPRSVFSPLARVLVDKSDLESEWTRRIRNKNGQRFSIAIARFLLSIWFGVVTSKIYLICCAETK
jgi:hypothetical protein